MQEVKHVPGLKQLTVGVVGAMIAGGAYAGTVTTDGADIVIKTVGGIEAKTVDGDFKFKLGGRLMVDMDRFDGAYNEGLNKTNFQSELRRARIELKGTVYSDWHYALGADMKESGGNKIDVAYMKYTGLEFMDVTLGRTKQPFGLEELTSSKWISTIERSMIWDLTNAGGKARQLQLGGTAADQFTWAIAGFDNNEDSDETGSSIIGYAGRLTWSPVHDTGNVIHLGLAYSDANPGGDVATGDLKSRGSVHTAEKFTLLSDPGAMIDDDTTLGFEGAWVMGPLSVQGEYIMRGLDLDTGASVDVDGYYLQGTYTLTGESRSYKWKSGKFDKLKPKGANGAVELVAKYEAVSVDDDDSATDDASADVITLGVNWYPNQNVKLMLNYLMFDTDEIFTMAGEEEDGDAVAFRAQYAF